MGMKYKMGFFLKAQLTMVTHHNCVSVILYIHVWCMGSYLLAPVISYNLYLWWEPGRHWGVT